ncbi:fibronectin type III domain-containing protein [Desulfoplanes formicivorans]|uniref:Fibronectin type-III domain-containing protein n=1 Tax=Desulfoplanes formicivorans TaxID=1592317 RepID=A0A194AIM0_9BACT|nr:fibronectin type III domain-containing protein [Desulfoplanes formicivorans]GAU08921.1 hypothetical protein DPF_1640 [Desulfoplanes formicivorans]
MPLQRTPSLILICFLAVFVVHAMPARATAVTISWNANSDKNLNGYRVHYGTKSRDYQYIEDVGNITRYVTDDLQEGETYFFAATAYDLYGNESDYSQEVSYTVPTTDTPTPDPEPVSQGRLRMETGEVDVDHNWTTVELSQTFSDPIVIANLMGFVGSDPSVIRIRNVSPSGFQIRVQEWDYLDGIHKTETIGFVVVERGLHTLDDGTMIRADSFRTNRTTSFENVQFGTEFSTVPVVVTSIATVEDEAGVAGRMKNISTKGFQYKMQEEENADQVHAAETVMYIAWEESQGQCGDIAFEVKNSHQLFGNGFQTQYLDTQFTSSPVFVAEMQTCSGSNPSTLRYTDKTINRIDIQVVEEQSKDSEMDHYNECIGYLAFTAGSATIQDSDNGGQEPSDPPTDPDDSQQEPGTAMNIELGEVSVDHEWTTITFDKTYTDPVVIASGISYAGYHPSVIRIRNLTTRGCEIMVQEWDYLDGTHTTETIGYIVAEKGTHVLADGTMISAGSTQVRVTNAFVPVTFDKALTTAPVVLTCITSTNDNAAVITRMQNITATGFETSIQEQEKSDQNHGTETVSYIAWEPSAGVIDQQAFQVGTTGSAIDSAFSTVTFDAPFDRTPALMAAMQTMHGDNPSGVRYDKLTTKTVKMMIEEEQSADTEMDHLDENVGYIVFEK